MKSKFFLVLFGLIVAVMAIMSVIFDDNARNEFSFLIVLFALGAASSILHILYFETSFLIRGTTYRPKTIESIIIGVLIGIGFLFKSISSARGESGLAFIYLSPIFVVVFAIAGLPVVSIYKKRNQSLFKKKISQPTTEDRISADPRLKLGNDINTDVLTKANVEMDWKLISRYVIYLVTLTTLPVFAAKVIIFSIVPESDLMYIRSAVGQYQYIFIIMVSVLLYMRLGYIKPSNSLRLPLYIGLLYWIVLLPIDVFIGGGKLFSWFNSVVMIISTSIIGTLLGRTLYSLKTKVQSRSI